MIVPIVPRDVLFSLFVGMKALALLNDRLSWIGLKEPFNRVWVPAIDVRGDGIEIGEDARLKYRYLDLRRPRMQKNIRDRDKIISFFRDYMHKENFVEIETPILMKGTPEGSREYVVPSRLTL